MTEKVEGMISYHTQHRKTVFTIILNCKFNINPRTALDAMDNFYRLIID